MFLYVCKGAYFYDSFQIFLFDQIATIYINFS